MLDASSREKLAIMAREAKDHSPTLEVLVSQPLTRLRYSIAEASSFSGIYEPHNILYDRPQDLTSRWSGAAVASIAPNSSSSNASGSGGGNGPTSAAQRSSSPIAGSRDVGWTSPSASHAISSNSPAASKIASVKTAAGNAHFAGDKQYIILKLEKLSVLRKIHFGKYHKPHPCNLKDFKVYGSQSVKDAQSHAWVRILRGGLRNDSQSEAFDVQWTNSEGVPFPVRYVKLVPLATHSPNYNFSVWHIALEGVSEQYTVERVMHDYQEHRESTAIRLILKHLRGRSYHTAFKTLLQSCKLDAPLGPHATSQQNHKRPFEHPCVTQLFQSLMQGSWDAAEDCLEKAAWGEAPRHTSTFSAEGDELGGARESSYSEASSTINSAASLFASYVDRSMPKAKWTRIIATDNDGDSPCGRGGHEMELDSEKGIIWLFGGWDGSKDLADLWAYHIHEAKWRCISRDVRTQGGPSPRSCHKMVFDPRTGFLYVLGRFVDYERAPVVSAAAATSATGSNLLPNRSSASPNLAQRGSSPFDRSASPSGPPSTSVHRNATRGFFLPRAPPETVPQSASNANGDNSSDFLDEIFGSTRGGNTRLTSGRTSFLNVDRGLRPDGSLSGIHSPNQGSPAPTGPSMTGFESDFYRFSTRTERWDRLSFDTHSESGPKLVFDHQMVIDPDTQLLYVFGGRVAHPDSSKVELSGMWKYDVIQRSWTFLFDDLTHAQSRIPSRVGHTMLLDTSRKGSMAGRKLIWVLAGQRNNQYLADMWTYQPSTGAVREVCKDSSLVNGPEGGFTQRAAIDCNSRELYLFSGLVKRSKNKGEKVKSAFWIYNIERADWRMVYQYGGLGSLAQREGSSDGGDEDQDGANGDEDTIMDATEPLGGPIHAFPSAGLGDDPYSGPETNADSTGARQGASHSQLAPSEPLPRYAAQLMYNSKQKFFYIFGGNPANSIHSSLRLDDLWSLELLRPGLSEVLRKAKFKLRQQRFLELAQEHNRSSKNEEQIGLGAGWKAMQALVYLQTQVSQVVNHDIAEESQAFRKLMAHLLNASTSTASTNATLEATASSPLVSPSELGIPTVLLSSATPTEAPLGANTTQQQQQQQQPQQTERVTSPAPAPSAAVGQHSAKTSESGSGEEEESEMLSISQILPNAAASSSSVRLDAGEGESQSNLGHEGKPSVLYKQRYNLFKALLDFFPAEAIEPDIDLVDCIEISKLSF